MQKTLLKSTVTGLLATSLLGCSLFSEPERVPYYPQIRDVHYSSEDIPVIESDNVLKSAIKQNRFIDLTDQQGVNLSTEAIFAEVMNSQALTAADLQSEWFHHGVAEVIKQFSCELYASQQPAQSIQLCPQSNQVVDNNLGYFPFQEGLRYTERLSSTQVNPADSLQLELFLKSTHERTLDSLWGAVHELGTFKDSTLSEDSLVLTININAYKRNEVSSQWQFMYPDPLIFFVVLPSVDNILSRPNEVEAMNFAYRSSKLLVVDSR